MFHGDSAVDVTDEGPSARASGKIAGMATTPTPLTAGTMRPARIWSSRSPPSATTSWRYAAVKRWPKDKITLRNRARVIEQSWED
jgi:hypothetical protein